MTNLSVVLSYKEWFMVAISVVLSLAIMHGKPFGDMLIKVHYFVVNYSVMLLLRIIH